MKKLTIIALLILISGISVFAQGKHPFPPAPVLSDLLGSVYVDRTGILKINRFNAYFVPGETGRIKILRDGAEIAEYKFTASPAFVPKYEIDSIDLVKGKNATLGFKVTEPGKYTMLIEFIGGESTYVFPFEVIAKGGNDPYKPNKTILLNGDWNDFAFLEKTSEEAHGRWEFNVWMRSDDGKQVRSSSEVQILRDSDGKLVGYGQKTFRRDGYWKREDIEIKKPLKKNSAGNYETTDLPANSEKFEDGSYTVKFLLDGNLYGTYKFTVRNGEIEHQGRQVRDATDPKRFIEGGGKEFWMKKQ